MYYIFSKYSTIHQITTFQFGGIVESIIYQAQLSSKSVVEPLFLIRVYYQKIACINRVSIYSSIFAAVDQQCLPDCADVVAWAESNHTCLQGHTRDYEIKRKGREFMRMMNSCKVYPTSAPYEVSTVE